MFDAHIICRFSSQDKEETSIERQKQQCLEVALKLGCDPENVKIIANDNLSGALSWNKRVDLIELENDIRQGLCQRLIVYRFDRLARDFEVSGKLLNILRQCNIELYDETGKLEYQSASGQAFFGMKSVFASLERDLIKERTYSGKKQKAKNGLYVGGSIPLGYILDTREYLSNGERNNNYGKIKPYPPHAELVREIFNRLYSENHTPTSLALAFHKEGRVIPNFDSTVAPIMVGKFRRTALNEKSRVKDGYKITPKIIRNIVTNPVYVGVWKWGTITLTNNHEPLISEEIFSTIAKRYSGNIQPRRGRAAYTEPLPLSGLVRCQEHKCLVHAHSTRQIYVCISMYQRGESQHLHFQLPSYVLDDPICEYILKQCSFSQYTNEVLNRMRADRKAQLARLSNIERIKKKLQKEIENLKDGLADARNKQERLYFLDGINERNKALAELDLERVKQSEIVNETKQTKLIHNILSDIYSYWPRIPNHLKNRLLRILIDHIEISHAYNQSNVEVTIYSRSGKKQQITINYHSYWRGPKWTLKEEQILERLWPYANTEHIKEELPNRSWSSIKTKAIRMGLKRLAPRNYNIKYRSWQSWEEELLRQHLKGKIDIDELVRLIERTPKAIIEKTKRMGLCDHKKATKRLKVNWKDESSLPFKNEYLHAGSRHEPLPLRLLW